MTNVISAPQGARWSFVKVGVQSMDAADRVLQSTVLPMARDHYAAAAGPESTWFFMRFLDSSGLHLRIRIRDEHVPLQAAESALQERLAHCSASEKGLIRFVESSYYVPEWRKWGGPDGVHSAEAVFAQSSRFAIGHVNRSREERRALALAIMWTGLALIPADQARSFCYNYAWYWSGAASSMLARARPRIREKAAGVSKDFLALAEDSLRQLKEDEQFSRYTAMMRSDLDAGGPRGFRLFNHLHLTANRLGVTTPEEALLAELTLREGNEWWRES
jgi:thiopeptide-type bacteriocin biosynthesis protein